MIKRSHVRKFLAVVDSGSFTSAAARIRVTQPTLSAGIADLEKIIGVPLFIRDRKKVRLTEAGGRFLPVARELENQFRAADSFAREPSSEWPDIKLGIIRTAPDQLLQRIYSACHSTISLELVETTDAELRSHLNSGRINAAVALLRPGEQGENIIPLLSEPYVMFVSKEHPLAYREEANPSDFGAEIMIARRSCEMLDATSRFFTSFGVRPRFALRSENDRRCMQMVSLGLGITTAPLSFAIQGTVPIRIRGYDFMRDIGLITNRPMNADNDKLGKFLAFAANEFGHDRQSEYQRD